MSVLAMIREELLIAVSVTLVKDQRSRFVNQRIYNQNSIYSVLFVIPSLFAIKETHKGIIECLAFDVALSAVFTVHERSSIVTSIRSL